MSNNLKYNFKTSKTINFKPDFKSLFRESTITETDQNQKDPGRKRQGSGRSEKNRKRKERSRSTAVSDAFRPGKGRDCTRETAGVAGRTAKRAG